MSTSRSSAARNTAALKGATATRSRSPGPAGKAPRPGRPVSTVRLRIVFGPGVFLGPGKADLLEAIGSAGSISAAARSMQMSYKRAWQLVDELNRMFTDPLVDRAKGGAHGGGARLTATGEQVLGLYRQAEDAAATVGGPAIEALRRRLA